MSTSRAVLLLVGIVLMPVTLGVVGLQIAETAGALVGFVLGCIPAVLLWRRTPRTGYPSNDDGDIGFWVSDSASHNNEVSESGGWEGGGGEAAGGGADGGGD
jgi:hypothetical protein